MNKAIEEIKKEFESYLIPIEDEIREIVTQEDLDFHVKMAKRIKDLRKEVEKKEKEETQEAAGWIKAVKEITRPVIEGCKKWEGKLKVAIDTYLAERERQARETEKTVVEAIQSGDVEGAVQQLEEIKKPTGVKERRIQELVITDESKIPDQYWKLDLVQIRKDLLAGHQVEGAEMQEKVIGIV